MKKRKKQYNVDVPCRIVQKVVNPSKSKSQIQSQDDSKREGQ